MKSLVRLMMPFLAILSCVAQTPQVVIQKDNGSNKYIFKANGAVTIKAIGTMQIGNTILIRYGLHIKPDGKARFIATDFSKVTGKHPNPTLSESELYVPGFVIKDSRQPVVNIHINPKIIKQVRKDIQNGESGPLNAEISKNANMDVEFKNVNGRLVISRVDIN